jgi:tetratricopeptide (TPR) repeat protein
MLYNNIGDVCDNLGLYEKAIEVFGKALKILDKTVGYYHPSTATVLNNIGTTYYEQEKYNEAMEYYGKALEIRIKVLRSDHPDTMAAQENINEAERSIVEGQVLCASEGKSLL